jgi:SAM-dependent methyltransferase
MDFLDKIHPERRVSGFTKNDGTVIFFSFVKSIIRDLDARRVMDFGAGRGVDFLEVKRSWLTDLRDLREYGSIVYACDIDPIVLSHPASHHQAVIERSGGLPFEDDFFDVIVSDVTFEHVENPEAVARELLRVLRPGGYICARTPNKLGYAQIATRLVPNRLHVAALRYIQPDRKGGPRDVFPTKFRMNSVRQIKKLFAGCPVAWYRNSGEPAYYFGNQILYRLLLAVHKLLPDRFATSICFFIRKPE